jgi:Putative Ig domain
LRRLVLFAAFAALLVALVALPASAASFDDSNPCPADGPLLVCPTAQVGHPYSLQLRALAGCDLYRWEIPNGSLPTGLSMSSSGLVTGTPKSSGETKPWMTVHDLTAPEGGYPWCGGDNKSERQFVFKVDPGLSIQNQSVPGGTVGQPYSQTLTALAVTSLDPLQSSPANPTWSIQSGSLPAGVTLSTAGLLSGTPTTEGSYTFVVKAQAGNTVDTETETLTVRQPVVVTSPFAPGQVAPRLEVGVPYTAAQSATGGSGTFTWTLASGTVPPGLELKPDGSLSGTPTEPGRYTFGVKVADTEGRVTTLNATLVVAAQLEIETLTLKPAKVGRAYRQKIARTGGVAPLEWKLLRGKLPKGVTLAKKLGLLLGTPTKAGKYRFVVQAVDALGVKASKNLTITVRG